MRSLVLAFLWTCLFLTAACHSWGNFWEEAKKKSDNSGSTTTVFTGNLELIAAPTASNFILGYTGVATLLTTIPSLTAFSMAKYEVQYGDWVAVKTWAASNGYTIINAGVQGDNGARTNQHPVTTISWRDAIVWCNAASEKQGLTPVYYTNSGMTTPLRISTNSPSVDTAAGSEDNPYVNWSANGYRLPTEVEWEYAARYIDGVTFLAGNFASGASADVTNFAATSAVAWFGETVLGAKDGNTVSTQPVGQKTANALGIYDMSGNVNELVWDWNNGNYPGSTVASDYTGATSSATNMRVIRGGDWSYIASSLRAAYRDAMSPWSAQNYLGFRPVRRP